MTVLILLEGAVEAPLDKEAAAVAAAAGVGSSSLREEGGSI
jgi:hypothetical protein